MVAKAGDWVRFYNGGRMVLAIVQYVRKQERYPNKDEAYTEICPVEFDRIIEVRSANAAGGVTDGQS